MLTEDIDYACDDVTMRGYLARIESRTEGPKRPGVLVFHEGIGLEDFACAKARQLAGLGYVALAADMFGERRQARNLQEVATVVGGLRAAPARLRARAEAALATLAGRPEVDPTRLAAIGFCFGGSVVLELARSGADLKAAVCFHGMLGTQIPPAEGQVKASILVLTGAEDPLVPPDQVAAFEEEMRAAKVRDWQVVSYGNVLHGFANPAADGSMMRTAKYHEKADRRSWQAMKALFDEVLA